MEDSAVRSYKPSWVVRMREKIEQRGEREKREERDERGDRGERSERIAERR